MVPRVVEFDVLWEKMSDGGGGEEEEEKGRRRREMKRSSLGKLVR